MTPRKNWCSRYLTLKISTDLALAAPISMNVVLWFRFLVWFIDSLMGVHALLHIFLSFCTFFSILRCSSVGWMQQRCSSKNVPSVRFRTMSLFITNLLLILVSQTPASLTGALVVVLLVLLVWTWPTRHGSRFRMAQHCYLGTFTQGCIWRALRKSTETNLPVKEAIQPNQEQFMFFSRIYNKIYIFSITRDGERK